MKAISDLHPLLVVSPSKALLHLFTKMRRLDTDSETFVKYSKRAMRILAEDAIAELPNVKVVKDVQTPCGTVEGAELVEPSSVCAISIIRSGDALLEAVREVEPAFTVGKILIQRDESDPEKPAKLYYSKLPEDISSKYILLCDPMLATGGSAIKALDVLCQTEHRVPQDHIVFANMICAPEGLEALRKAYPGVKVVTACIDDCLNEEKFIVPGLGDYGDRFFNT